MWLIRSVDSRGKVDRAGFLSRPAVPSRARASGRPVCLAGFDSVIGSDGLSVGSCISEELAIDRVTDAALEAAQRLERGFAGGELASVVGTTFGVVAQLHDGRDMEDVVHPPVPGP